VQRRTIEARQLSASAWGPFGWVPVRDTDPRDGAQTLHFQWGDPHVNVICHRLEEVPETPRGLLCEMFFHHLTHTQALLVLNSRAVIAVAPSGCRFAHPADIDQIRAFVLDPHDSVVIAPGTWHWGPFPIGTEQVDLFNVQGRGYAKDNEKADLRAFGGIEVAVTR
jgi:hypothetical protein